MVAGDQPVLGAPVQAEHVAGHKAYNGVVVHAVVEGEHLTPPRPLIAAAEPLHSDRFPEVVAEVHQAEPAVTQDDVPEVYRPGDGAGDQVGFPRSTARAGIVWDGAGVTVLPLQPYEHSHDEGDGKDQHRSEH